jgi:hypothetical protein
MNYIKLFENFNTGLFSKMDQMEDNIIQYTLEYIDDNIVNVFKKEFPDKWILDYRFDNNSGYIFVKDIPGEYEDEIPKFVYHVSSINNLDEKGIKTSTDSNSPFGYYGLTFFYINEEDLEIGSIPYIKGKNFAYIIDTSATNNWLENPNYNLDGEDCICTSDFVKPEFVKRYLT